MILTLEHLDGHSGHYLWPQYALHLCPHHLAKRTLTQQLPHHQPGAGKLPVRVQGKLVLRYAGHLRAQAGAGLAALNLDSGNQERLLGGI